MRLRRARIRDFRSVPHEGVDLDLGPYVLAVVGPHFAGKSNVVRALAASLDPRIAVDPARDAPEGSDGQPTVTTTYDLDDREVVLDVGWPGGRRRVFSEGPLPQDAGDLLYVPQPPASAPDDGAVVDQAAGAGSLPGAAELLAVVQRILPAVEQVGVERADLRFRDRWGGPTPPGLLRGAVALARARARHAAGHAVAAVVLDEPGYGLHPAAQQALGDLIVETADLLATPVVVATSSPCLLPPRTHDIVLALDRDPSGATRVVGSARGDEDAARRLGGLDVC